MRKAKELWIKVISASVLWFVIPTFIIVLAPTLWYTRPLLNLNSDDITIYKFAITILGVTVGVGTVINSTRSAKTAAESMEITKRKDIREQSSHPIVLSLIENFPYSAPLYKQKIIYNFGDETTPSVEAGSLARNKDDLNEATRKIVRNVRLKYVDQLNQSLYDQNNIENSLKIKNVGKGSCTNISYKFDFMNMNQYDNYKVSAPVDTDGFFVALPSYQMEVKKIYDEYEIAVIDNHIKNYLDFVELEEPYKSSKVRKIIRFKDQDLVRNYSFLEADGQLDIPIPNEFVIMCKHYVIVNIIKNRVKNGEIFSSLLPSIKPLLEVENIKPTGLITLSYYDESLIRSTEYYLEDKTHLVYSISVNDDATTYDLDSFDMYLEVNMLSSENTP